MAARITPKFYAAIQASAELDAIVGDPSIYQRLSASFRQYVLNLAAPPVGTAYTQRIQRIAAEHVRVGLSPDWYMAAYRLIWVGVWRVIEDSGRTSAEREAMVHAVSKRLMADMVLTISEYDRRHQAFYDALTGALTRYAWAEWVAQWPSDVPPVGVVAVIDLDDFKWINDTYGHGIGDRILQQFVARLIEAVPETARVFRWGGDEFQVRCSDVDAAEAAQFAGHIHHAVTRDPFTLRDDDALYWGVSVGFAHGPLTVAAAEQADQALLHAKRSGKNQVQSADSAAEPGPPVPRLHAPDLGWLAGAVHSLWAEWDHPAVLTNIHGDSLYANAAYHALEGHKPLVPPTCGLTI